MRIRRIKPSSAWRTSAVYTILMNNRTAIGLVAAIIIVGILIFAFGSHPPSIGPIPLGTTTASSGSTTPSTTTSTKPSSLIPSYVTTGGTVNTTQSGHVTSTTPAPRAAFDIHNQ